MEIIYDEIMEAYAVVLADDRVLLLGAETYRQAQQEVEAMLDRDEHLIYD